MAHEMVPLLVWELVGELVQLLVEGSNLVSVYLKELWLLSVHLKLKECLLDSTWEVYPRRERSARSLKRAIPEGIDEFSWCDVSVCIIQ